MTRFILIAPIVEGLLEPRDKWVRRIQAISLDWISRVFPLDEAPGGRIARVDIGHATAIWVCEEDHAAILKALDVSL